MASTFAVRSGSQQVDIGVFAARKAIKTIVDFAFDATPSALPALAINLKGRIAKVVYIPGGTTITAASILGIKDPDSAVDVCFGQVKVGATALEVYPVYSPAASTYVPLQPLVSGNMNLSLTGNSVASATGTFEIYTIDG